MKQAENPGWGESHENKEYVSNVSATTVCTLSLIEGCKYCGLGMCENGFWQKGTNK
jgi:hypothetical protein